MYMYVGHTVTRFIPRPRHYHKVKSTVSFFAYRLQYKHNSKIVYLTYHPRCVLVCVGVCVCVSVVTHVINALLRQRRLLAPR